MNTDKDKSTQRDPLLSHFELTQVEQVLQVSVNKQNYCFPLNRVERVLPLMSLQPVPGGPNYLVGLLSMQGDSIPVIDLSIRIGLTVTEPYSVDTSVILCFYEDKRVGVISQIVDGIVSLDFKQIKMQADFQKAHLPYLATINGPGGSSLLLDISRLVLVNYRDDLEDDNEPLEKLESQDNHE